MFSSIPWMITRILRPGDDCGRAWCNASNRTLGVNGSLVLPTIDSSSPCLRFQRHDSYPCGERFLTSGPRYLPSRILSGVGSPPHANNAADRCWGLPNRAKAWRPTTLVASDFLIRHTAPPILCKPDGRLLIWSNG